MVADSAATPGHDESSPCFELPSKETPHRCQAFCWLFPSENHWQTLLGANQRGRWRLSLEPEGIQFSMYRIVIRCGQGKSGRQTPRRWGWRTPLKKRAATRIYRNNDTTRFRGNPILHGTARRFFLRGSGTPRQVAPVVPRISAALVVGLGRVVVKDTRPPNVSELKDDRTVRPTSRFLVEGRR